MTLSPTRTQPTPVSRWVCWVLTASITLIGLAGCQGGNAAERPAAGTAGAETLRVATFNTAMSRDEPGALRDAMRSGTDAKAKLVAEVLQRTRPDIVLLQEVDHDPTGATYDAFQVNYLAVPQNGAEPIDYPYRYAPEVNTGVLSGIDLNNDGRVALPHDAHGWGNYPGHYGMVVLSKHPLDVDAVQSCRELPWFEVDREAMLGPAYYSDDAKRGLRLSSKTHAVVPVRLGDARLHLLVSHPTPPVFDGPEDRNGYRNAAEIALWAKVLGEDHDGRRARFLGPSLPPDARFVVLGDLNADPLDGDSRPGAMDVLLHHPRIQPLAPTSEGAVEAAQRDGGANRGHRSDPAADTTDWADDPSRGPGNLRVDYVLPSTGLTVIDAGVYWPVADDPHAYLLDASDHRLVWADLAVE